MGIFTWIIFGLVAGALAKLIMPGDDPGGIIVTCLIGIAGAVVGGMIATAIGWGEVSGFNIYSMCVAIAGSLLLLGAYRLLRRKKT